MIGCNIIVYLEKSPVTDSYSSVEWSCLFFSDLNPGKHSTRTIQ